MKNMCTDWHKEDLQFRFQNEPKKKIFSDEENGRSAGAKAGASSNRLINKYGVRVWKHENWQKQTGVKSAKETKLRSQATEKLVYRNKNKKTPIPSEWKREPLKWSRDKPGHHMDSNRPRRWPAGEANPYRCNKERKQRSEQHNSSAERARART